MSEIQISNRILYSIDMGSPTAGGGFFAYRWREDDISQYNPKLWRKCIDDFVEDFFASQDFEICLAIEAPLSGLRDDGGLWLPRFSCLGFSEKPWYTNAGAVTSMMALQFLAELQMAILKRMHGIDRKSNVQRRIRLYESYISGLHGAGKKPKLRVHGKVIGRSKSHEFDAFETLLMLSNEFGYSSSSIKYPNGMLKLFHEDWIDFQNKSLRYNDGDEFRLGHLAFGDSIFDLKMRKILFTKRSFDIS